MSAKLPDGHFQMCRSCRTSWPTWESFAVDPDLRLLGLQAVISNPDINLLVFEHRCGSSVSILSRRLRHLLPPLEPGAPATRALGTELCGGHCLKLEDLEACQAPCGNARDRELIRIVQRMREQQARPSGPLPEQP